LPLLCYYSVDEGKLLRLNNTRI